MSSQLFLSYEIKGQTYITELTCTTSVNVDFKNIVTSFPVEGGSYISDHVNNAPIEITFSGVISDITNYSLEYNQSTSDTIKNLKFLRESNIPFTVNISDQLDAYSNCVFNGFNISQSSGSGTSWNAELSMVQIQVGTSSTLGTFAENSIKEQHDSKKTQGDNNKEGGREATFLESLEIITTSVVTLGGSVSYDAIGKALSDFEFGEVSLTPRSNISTR